MFRKFNVILAVLAASFSSQSRAFGPEGHQLVGAIADQKLKSTSTATKIVALIDGMSLEEVAVIPDSIKSFDQHPDRYVLAGHPAIQDQLRAFLQANPHRPGSPSDHHDFHYTDVPVIGNSVYSSGSVGRSDHDLVRMIPFCVRVLKGQEPDNNPRKITRPVAVILLAHYLGDLNQPLHVGAQYFDNSGNPTNPDTSTQWNGDTGGNSLILHLRAPDGTLKAKGALHHYWDDDAVTTAKALYRAALLTAGASDTSDAAIAVNLAGKAPAGWTAPAGPAAGWAEAWADEILPAAREAHSRLEFSHMMINSGHHSAAGQAIEKIVPDGSPAYAAFAGSTVRDSMHRGGWRLAWVLQDCLP